MRRPPYQRPSFGRKPNAERVARAVELYAAGVSSVEIGRRLDMTPTNVLLALRGAGVTLRDKREAIASGKRRASRLRAIAEAAQARFGHICVGVAKPVALPPVNEMFCDDVPDIWSEWGMQ